MVSETISRSVGREVWAGHSSCRPALKANKMSGQQWHIDISASEISLPSASYFLLLFCNESLSTRVRARILIRAIWCVIIIAPPFHPLGKFWFIAEGGTTAELEAVFASPNADHQGFIRIRTWDIWSLLLLMRAHRRQQRARILISMGTASSSLKFG